MSWIDCLIDRVPDLPSAGAWLFTYGVIGGITASCLRDFPMSVESILLLSSGAIHSALADLKRRKMARITRMTQEEEEAMVEAGLQAMEAEAEARSVRIHMVSSEAPLGHRLH